MPPAQKSQPFPAREGLLSRRGLRHVRRQRRLRRAPSAGACPCPLNRIAHRAGLRVNELNAEMMVEAAMVSANCLKNSPLIPAMKAVGTNTAVSTSAMAMTAPRLRHGLSGCFAGIAAHGQKPLDIFHDHNRIVNDNPNGQHQSEQRRLLSENPNIPMTAIVPISETGTAIIGTIVARQSCRNRSTTINTSIKASIKRLENFVNRFVDKDGRVVVDFVIDTLGKFGAERAILALMASAVFSAFEPGNWKTAIVTAGLPSR